MKKIKKLNANTPISLVQSKSGLVSSNTSSDPNAEVAALGTQLGSDNTNLGNSDSANTIAHNAAKTATTDLKNKKKTTIDTYGKLADKAMEKYPNDPDTWEAMGFTTTKDPSDLSQPVKITGGSVTHGDAHGEADIHWNSLKEEAEFYELQETTGDPTDDTTYYSTNPPSALPSKVTVEVKTRNVNVWFRVRAHNAAGYGAWSDPFGGFPIY